MNIYAYMPYINTDIIHWYYVVTPYLEQDFWLSKCILFNREKSFRKAFLRLLQK